MQEILSFLQNHWMLTSALVVLFVLLSVIELIRQKQGAQRLSPAQVIQFMNHQEATVIDVRPSDAFRAGHIIGSANIPLAEMEKNSKKLEKYKSKPIILVCANGIESARATNTLLQQGYNIFMLAGGIRSWRETEMPLVKD